MFFLQDLWILFLAYKDRATKTKIIWDGALLEKITPGVENIGNPGGSL